MRIPEQVTALEKPSSRWKLKPREIRMLLYLLVVVAVAAWKFMPRPWHPTLTVETPHHLIYSTATPQQTEEVARALGFLHGAYSNLMGSLPQLRAAHPALKVKLYKDRAELRRINPGLGWAEAFYREPYCQAFYSAEEINPLHWMLHESVHQLNQEVAHLKLEHWLEEGLAEYFSTSRMNETGLALGRIDPNTYPIWWIDEIATKPILAENIRNGSVIPLRAIVTNRDGPSMDEFFNLYYLHWWTLTHFVFESPKYRDRALELVRWGGDLAAFEEIIGPVAQVEEEWHTYVRQLKSKLSGEDLKELRARRKLDQTNSLPIPTSH